MSSDLRLRLINRLDKSLPPQHALHRNKNAQCNVPGQMMSKILRLNINIFVAYIFLIAHCNDIVCNGKILSKTYCYCIFKKNMPVVFQILTSIQIHTQSNIEYTNFYTLELNITFKLWL